MTVEEMLHQFMKKPDLLPRLAIADLYEEQGNERSAKRWRAKCYISVILDGHGRGVPPNVWRDLCSTLVYCWDGSRGAGAMLGEFRWGGFVTCGVGHAAWKWSDRQEPGRVWPSWASELIYLGEPLAEISRRVAMYGMAGSPYGKALHRYADLRGYRIYHDGTIDAAPEGHAGRDAKYPFPHGVSR
jgi:hypothetical protein